MQCPKCKGECQRDSVHNGVGWMYGPWGCIECKWSEWEEYDLSTGKSPVRENGSVIDQFGGLWPAASPYAKSVRRELDQHGERK